jgi:hypothetical protein
MRRSNGTSHRRRQSQRQSNGHGTGGGDPLAYVRDREQADLISDLDVVHDVLMGRALDGDAGSYELAATVRSASRYLVNLRLNTAR